MYPTYVLVALASRNSVFERLFQNFVLSNAFFMVILSNFEFTIDFVRRNAAYTLYSSRAQQPFRPFLQEVMLNHLTTLNNLTNLAKRNRFGKRSVSVLGPGELIRRGNFYGMTGVEHLIFDSSTSVPL